MQTRRQVSIQRLYSHVSEYPPSSPVRCRCTDFLMTLSGVSLALKVVRLPVLLLFLFLHYISCALVSHTNRQSILAPCLSDHIVECSQLLRK